jgi:hypothetical protein
MAGHIPSESATNRTHSTIDCAVGVSCPPPARPSRVLGLRQDLFAPRPVEPSRSPQKACFLAGRSPPPPKRPRRSRSIGGITSVFYYPWGHFFSAAPDHHRLRLSLLVPHFHAVFFSTFEAGRVCHALCCPQFGRAAWLSSSLEYGHPRAVVFRAPFHDHCNSILTNLDSHKVYACVLLVAEEPTRRPLRIRATPDDRRSR